MAASPQSAAAAEIADQRRRLNFRRLRYFATGSASDTIVRAVCFGSNKLGYEGGVWVAAEHAGWETMCYTRSQSGREKEVDQAISVEITKDLVQLSYIGADCDVTLFSGDRDQLPVIEMARSLGYGVDVASWEHITSARVRRAARRWIRLDDHFDYLTFRT